MKKAFGFLLLYFIAASCTAQNHSTGFTSDKKLGKYLWFKEGYMDYSPDSIAIIQLKKEVSEYSILVFGGTWCHDTQNLLPQFYKVTDLAGMQRDSIDLYLLDIHKRSKEELENSYHINAIPTFILLKNGKEAGRIVEKTDVSIEKDLVHLLEKKSVINPFQENER